MHLDSSTASRVLLALDHVLKILSGSTALQQIQHIRIEVSALLSLESVLSTQASFSQSRLAGFFLLCFATCTFFVNYPFSRTRKPASPSSPLLAISALSRVLIPTCSIWPQYYIDLARSAEKTGTKRICIPLNVLLRDIKQGRIELRSSSTDLSLLIRGELVIDAWCFGLNVSLTDKMKALVRTLFDELTLFPDEVFPEPIDFPGEDTHVHSTSGPNHNATRCAVCGPEMNVISDVILQYVTQVPPKIARGQIPMSPLNSHGYRPLKHITVWPSLDTIPGILAERFIRSTQKALSTKLSAQGVSVFSFTTLESSLSSFHKSYALLATPFSHAHVTSSKSFDARNARSLGPLFIRLPHILALLTSGLHALRILALSNVSDTYADALGSYAYSLEIDDSLRREYIEGVGVQCWREERLYARWEAALLQGGMLTRWVVILGRKE